jgi:hypothetical protein
MALPSWMQEKSNKKLPSWMTDEPTVAAEPVRVDIKKLQDDRLEPKGATYQSGDYAKFKAEQDAVKNYTYEPVEPSYIDSSKDIFQKIRYNIMKKDAKKTAKVASEILKPSEWDLYRKGYQDEVDMATKKTNTGLSPEESQIYADLKEKVDYAKKNGVQKFIDKFGREYLAGAFGDKERKERAQKLGTDTTGSKVADVGAELAGLAASFSKSGTGGVGFAGPVRNVAENLSLKILGKVAPKQAAKLVTKKLAPELAEKPSIAARITNKALTGAVESLPYSAQQAVVNKQTPEEAAKNTLMNIGLGVGAELALGGLGAIGKGIIKKLKSGKQLTEPEIAAVETLPEEVKQEVYKALPSAQRLMLPERATSRIDAGPPKLTDYEKKVLKTPATTEKQKLKQAALNEQQRQVVEAQTEGGTKMLPEQPKKFQVPEQYRREMPTRVTSNEIKETTGEVPKLRTKPAEPLKPTENIQTPSTPKKSSYKLKNPKENKLLSSVRKSNQFPDRINESLKGEHEVKHGDELERQAIEHINKDPQKALKSVMEVKEPNDVTVESARILAKQALAEGREQDAINIINRTAENGVKYGREVQAFSRWGDTPEGMLLRANSMIEKSIPQEVKAAIRERAKEAKPIAEAINKVNAESIETVFKDFLNDKPKVSKAVREWLDREEGEARERIKDIFHPDPKKGVKLYGGIPGGELIGDLVTIGAAKLARKTMDFAEWSAEMIKEFGEKIRPYLQQIYDESVKLIKSKSLKTPEQKTVSTVDKAIRQALTKDGIRLQDIARKHMSEIDDTGKTLAQRFTDAGMNKAEAAKLEQLVVGRLRELTTEKKRQILNQMFKTRKPSVRKGLSDRIIELSNMGAIGDSQYTKILKEKYNIPELTPEEVKSIVKQTEYIQKITDVLEKQRLTNKMMNDIRKKLPVDWASKLKGATFVNTLLNPKTIISRNVPGNISQMLAMRFNKYLMTPVDVLRSAVTRTERRVTFRTGRGFMENVKRFAEDGLTGSKAGWEGYNPYGTAGEFTMPTQVLKSNYNPLKWAEKALGAALTGAGDYPFYMKAVLDHIGEQGMLKAMNQGFKGADLKVMGKQYADEIINSALKMSDTTKQILEEANQAGAEATFRNENIFSAALGAIHDGLNIVAGFGKSGKKLGKIDVPTYGLGDLVTMFVRTPGALINVGLEHSPLGLLKSLYYIAEGEGTKATQSIVKAISGTLFLSGAGYYLEQKGAITGKAPSDKEAISLMQEKGLREYSVNLTAIKRWAEGGFKDDSLLKPQNDDKWFTYDWMAPFSLNIGMGANASQDKLFENAKGLKGVAQAIPDTVAAAIQNIAGSDTISNVIRPFQGYSGDMLIENISNTAVNSLTRFIPFGSLLNMARQMTDNVSRNTKSDDPKVKAVNLIKNRIPGLSKELPAVITSTGQVKELYQGGTNNPLNVILNPAFVSKYSESPGSKIILDLYKSTGKVTQFPRLKTDITIYGKPTPLTDEQKADLQKYVGMQTMNALDTLPGAKLELNGKKVSFDSLSDQQKLDAIGYILTQIGNNAEVYMAEKLGIKKPTKAELKKQEQERATPKLKLKP